MAKALVLLLLLAKPGISQTATQQADFLIGPADLLQITVLGVADFTREVRVSGSGTISLPFLGAIQVAGLTCAQLETKLAKLLTPDYVKDPQVSVNIKEPLSRMFSILGAVKQPGRYQMMQSISLTAAISGAGGLILEKAGDIAIIQRNEKAKTDQVRFNAAVVPVNEEQSDTMAKIEVNLRKLLQEGDMSGDIQILPGDIINIPEATPRAFYVVGDLVRPGSFEYPKGRSVRLTRAMAMAGGPTKTSRLNKTKLIRMHADGSVDRFAVNINKVLEGKAPDMELQPNDMLYIPGSISKSLWNSLMGAIPYEFMRLVIPY